MGLATGNSTVLREEPPGEPLRSCHVGHRSPHERVVKIRQYLLFQKTQQYVASLRLHPVTWLGQWVTCHPSPLSRTPRWKRKSSPRGATTQNIDLCLELKDMKVVDWIRANCLSKFMVRMNYFLVLMPDVAIMASWPLSAPSFL